jgi:uncharacterized RDD family membrane protein YckC
VEPVGEPRDPTAVIGRRILAWVIDAVIVTAIFVGLYSAVAERYLNEVDAEDPCAELERAGVDTGSCLFVNDDVFVTTGSEALIVTVVGWGYVALVFVVVQGLTGATPGKLLTGVRVVDEQGLHPGLGKASVRTVMWLVDAAPWIVPLVGFITGVTTVGHRRVGDMAAKTYVVGKADTGAPVLIPGAAAPAPAWPYGSSELSISGPPPMSGSSGAEPPIELQPEPIWDERWATWVLWDEPRGQWLRWDAARSTWIPMQ